MKKTVVLCFTLFTGTLATAQQVIPAGTERTIIQQLFFDGLRSKLAGDYQNSMLSFSSITTIDSAHAAAWYEIALLEFRQQRLNESEAAIKKALNIETQNLWYLKFLAELYKTTTELEKIIPVLDRLIGLVPEDKSYYFDKANALAISGSHDAALEVYQVIEKKFGPSAFLERAKTRIRDVQKLPVDPLSLASRNIIQRNFTAARLILKSLTEQQKKNPLYYVLSGDIRYEEKDLKEALSNYKKAIKFPDQEFGVWEKVLSLQILLAEYKQVIQTADAALLLYPKQSVLYYYQAFALKRENQNQAALKKIEAVLSIEASNKPLLAMIFALYAEILIEERKTAAADLAFQKAVEADPFNFQIINNYAYYLALRNENLNKAEGLIALAAKAMPDDASVADTYALILFKAGKYAAAKIWIQKAIENKEQESHVFFEHYGDILFMLGEHQQALIQWRKSKDAGNRSPLLNRKINEKNYFK